MLSENHNNTGHWKSGLDGLYRLPGEEMPDKDSAWQRLHYRLHGKTPIHQPWHWAAAACLLMALVLSWMSTEKNNLRKIRTFSTEVKESTVHGNLTNQKDTIAAISESFIKKKSLLKMVIRKNELSPGADAKKTLLVDTNQVASNNIISSLPVPDSPVVSLAKAPAIKKLKVVHLNELGDAVEVSEETVHTRDIHLFKLKLARQEVYINPSVAINKTGFTILKTKPSSN